MAAFQEAIPSTTNQGVKTMNNVAIIQNETRQTVTFTQKPTPETCKFLRALGFDFDRRANQWYRRESVGTSVNESEVAHQFGA
jgi:hypothetical protein